MPHIKSFISNQYRPEIEGAKLDQSHKTWFFYTAESEQIQVIDIKAICIGPKNDIVLSELEHSVEDNDNILILYYEDIHKRWSFVANNDTEMFIFKKNYHEQYYLRPRNLYIRGCCVDETSIYWSIVGSFLNFIEMWTGHVICATSAQSSNESKLFQLSNSLKKSKNNKSSISIGKSYIIKSTNHAKFSSATANYIVKSLSSIRSRVVDQDDYKHWDWDTIQNLPVLFQEKVEGNDLRVHNLNNSLHAKLSLKKDKVDYRYSDGFQQLVNFDEISDELRDFCENVAKYEDNILLGIDFIKTNNGYVVLEANPSPGWASYYSDKGISRGTFFQKILEALKNG